MFALDQVDGVDAKEHFLFREAVLEELVQRDLGSVTEQIHEEEENARQELHVVHVHRVGVGAIRDQVAGHRGACREEGVVEDAQELGWVAVFGSAE